jgi:hypothetical protein
MGYYWDISPNNVFTLGVLTVVVKLGKAWCLFKVVSCVGLANLMSLTAQKFLDLPFSKEVSQET